MDRPCGLFNRPQNTSTCFGLPESKQSTVLKKHHKWNRGTRFQVDDEPTVMTVPDLRELRLNLSFLVVQPLRAAVAGNVRKRERTDRSGRVEI